MIKPIKKLKAINREKAQTMVEFALVFPIVLLITYGIIEFGRILFTYSAVTGAARDGARYGAVVGIDPAHPQFADCAGIDAAVRKVAFLTQISTITINYDLGIAPDKSEIGPIYNCTTVHANPKLITLGYRVKVTASAVYTPMIKFLGFSDIPINSYNARTIIMNIEAYP
jgi:Flp pilus assembly protein TadG